LSLKRLGETHSVELAWHAFELRPAGAPPLPPEYRARIEAHRPVFAARVKHEYAIEINQGPFGIHTRPLHQLKKYADAQGKGNAFHEAALDAYWMDARDVSDPRVQQELLKQIGIENSVAEVLQDETYMAGVLADERFAYENGMSGVPALVFGEKYLVVGAQPLDVLKQVVAQVREEQSNPE
jgi:predicted DsbA family dithiol-disulfide isomerase